MKPSARLRLWISAGLWAATLPATAGSLEEIYHKALVNDPQLKIADAVRRAAEEALPQARSALLPSINARANYTHTDVGQVDFDNRGYTVSLVQPVFSAARWFTYQRGKVLDQQAQLRFDQAQQNLIYRAVEAYLNVLRARSNVETANAQERAILRRLDQVNAQFEVGLTAITDVHEAQATYDNARVARIEAEGFLDNSYEALERLTGEAMIDIDPLSEDYPITLLQPQSAEGWVNKALADNLNLQLARSEIESAKRTAQIAKSGHYPTLDLNATYDRDRGTATSDDWTTAKVVGLTLAVPLYSGGAISSQSRQAYAQLDATVEALDDARRAVTQATRSLVRNLKTNVLSVSARSQGILSSKAALDATSEGYNVGTRNVVDVLAAEQALFAAQRDYANARFDYIQNLFALKQQLGTLNPDDLYSLDKWLVNKP